MYNLLIASTDMYFIKNLINSIMLTCNNIKIINISTNVQEAITEIKSGRVDIIILDLIIANLNSIQLLKQMYKIDLLPRPIIICLSAEIKHF